MGDSMRESLEVLFPDLNVSIEERVVVDGV